ncbi:cytochrome P450 [Cynara cardunculus var. scolymus]|uniref:Cytochrome P450 n=1 Tax=Cynara cardunculus var. scolymus TaxID=59895 RepID=A0A103XL37_CYNCS|nr:cytochrome P450 [Cynara cardunculus var. scolymus]
MDPEVNRFILMNEGKGFPPGYPQSMVYILGKSNIASVNGDAHKIMRGAFLSLVSPPIIRHQILPKTDAFMRTHLTNWTHQTIDIQQKTKEMAFLSSLNQIAGIGSSPLSKEFMAEFMKLARKKIVRMLEELIEDRRKSQEIHEDMLYSLMNGVDNRYKLSDEEIIDQIITILYSGFETVSTTSMMAIKYLHDHPRILEEFRVILETSRLATIVNGVLRKTTKEMELEGQLIMDKPLETENYFFVFGGGTRRCPGKELGIAEISTFLHYFVTRYRWEEVGGDEITKFPRVEAPNGLQIKVSPYRHCY